MVIRLALHYLEIDEPEVYLPNSRLYEAWFTLHALAAQTWDDVINKSASRLGLLQCGSDQPYRYDLEDKTLAARDFLTRFLHHGPVGREEPPADWPLLAALDEVGRHFGWGGK